MEFGRVKVKPFACNCTVLLGDLPDLRMMCRYASNNGGQSQILEARGAKKECQGQLELPCFTCRPKRRNEAKELSIASLVKRDDLSAVLRHSVLSSQQAPNPLHSALLIQF